MKHSFKPILVALLFAILLIASSYFLKGTSIGVWVDAGIYMAGVYLFFCYYSDILKAC
jgi:hypothetical protein